MSNIIYKETQKKAYGGAILDYPVTDVLIDSSTQSVSVLIRSDLSLEEATSLVCEFNAQMFLAEIIGKPIGAGPIVNLKIDLQGNLQQLIESLVRAGWISRVTHDAINSHPNSEITSEAESDVIISDFSSEITDDADCSDFDSDPEVLAQDRIYDDFGSDPEITDGNSCYHSSPST